MATRTRRSQRRTEALSRERIVEAAVELLDTAGEGGLTFRALTERLATGPGAIYWHVANKSELLGAVTDAVVADALGSAPDSVRDSVPAATPGSAPGSGPGSAPDSAPDSGPDSAPAGGTATGPATATGTGPATVDDGAAYPADTPAAASDIDPAGSPDSPRQRVRAVALGLFDAIDAHPWLATQLTAQFAGNPRGPVPPRIFESVGRQVQALGVPEAGWFTATSLLVHYILGAAAQNAVNSAIGRDLPPGMDRGAFLDSVSTSWEELEPDAYPFTRAVANQLRDHDDREQFLAGIDLVLAGITALHLPARPAGQREGAL
ncbi:TetR family transcriptional regulator [Streptomyces sp. 8L]|nr:TetR family transcriptional regulator [Streptomyces sp. 8L]MCA1219235.1 TetR family transcriptional regulator [Streptomyces sp. 8L]